MMTDEEADQHFRWHRRWVCRRVPPPQNRLAREGNGKRWVEIWPGIFSIESETLGWMNDEWLKIA
jgi:hypothetical protein